MVRRPSLRPLAEGYSINICRMAYQLKLIRLILINLDDELPQLKFDYISKRFVMSTYFVDCMANNGDCECF